MSSIFNWFLGYSYSGPFSIGSCDPGCNFPAVFEALVYNLIFLCLLKKLIDTHHFLVRQWQLQCFPHWSDGFSSCPNSYIKKLAVNFICPERVLWLNHRKRWQDPAFAFLLLCMPVSAMHSVHVAVTMQVTWGT